MNKKIVILILCTFLLIVSGFVYSFSNDKNNKDDYISNLIDSYKDIIIKKDIEINGLSDEINNLSNLLIQEEEYQIEIKTEFDEYEYYVDRYEKYHQINLKNYSINEIQYSEINEKSLELKAETIEETVWNIYDFVYLEYSYSFNSNGILETFNSKKGDCTDSSELAVYMLRVNNIYAKTVHGYSEGVKHDWIEVFYPNTNLEQVSWLKFDVLNKDNLVKYGDGIW